MTYAINGLRYGQGGELDSVITAASAFTAVAGEHIIVITNCLVESASPTISDIVGGNDTFVEIGAADGLDMFWKTFLLVNAVAGSCQIRADWGGAHPNYAAMHIHHISGLDGPFTAGAFQAQSNPGLATDGITSGLTGVLPDVPALVLAYCRTGGTPNIPAAGTGFTAIAGGGYNQTSAHKRVTATTAVAGTFTNQVDLEPAHTVVLVFPETAEGPPPPPAGPPKMGRRFYLMP